MHMNALNARVHRPDLHQNYKTAMGIWFIPLLKTCYFNLCKMCGGANPRNAFMRTTILKQAEKTEVTVFLTNTCDWKHQSLLIVHIQAKGKIWSKHKIIIYNSVQSNRKPWHCSQLCFTKKKKLHRSSVLLFHKCSDWGSFLRTGQGA